MKKSIYYLGIACANLMLFGSLFKIQHWPGASVMLVLAVFLFCFAFLPMALMNSYTEGGQKHKTLHIVTFIVFFISMMGVIFKVQHWPGAGALLPFGITLPFILFLPVYLYQTRNEKNKETMNFSAIMFGLTFLAVFSVLLALNVSKSIITKIANNIAMNDKFAAFSISTIKIADNQNQVVLASESLCVYIDGLKDQLLIASDNTMDGKASFDVTHLANTENSNIPVHILLGEGTNNKMEELKTKINSYRESLSASEKKSPELNELINTLFDVSDKDTEDGKITWEQRNFGAYQLIVVLDALTQIQSNVRLVESELLAVK
jgi:hypothetical protein